MDRPQILVFREKSLNYTCFDAKWVPKSARFVVLGCMPRQTGVIEVMKLTTNGLESLAQVCTHILFILKIYLYFFFLLAVTLRLKSQQPLNVEHSALQWKTVF